MAYLQRGCEQPSECSFTCMQWIACAEGQSLGCRRGLAKVHARLQRALSQICGTGRLV